MTGILAVKSRRKQDMKHVLDCKNPITVLLAVYIWNVLCYVMPLESLGSGTQCILGLL